MARFYNEADDTIITGTNGNDDITNSGSNVTINALGGADTIGNEAETVTIDGGAGNDELYNNGSNVSIYGGAGKDSITNDSEHRVTKGNNVTIDGGDDNDLIQNGTLDEYDWTAAGDSVSINGGAGNDTIYNEGSNVTIDGGAGDDSIINRDYNEEIYFKHTSGNDTISGFRATDTLAIASATYTTAKSGNNVIVTAGKGTITLIDAAGISDIYIETGTDTTSSGSVGGGGEGSIDGGEGSVGGGEGSVSGGSVSGGGEDTTPTALVTVNKTAKASLTGTTYDDEVINYGKNVTIRGGNGGDLITTMRKTSAVRIYGDAGDDTLEAYNATKVTLSGGTGNDEIFASGSQLTIIGGTGNDTIELDSTAAQIQYKSGEGNDVIDGFSDTATLKIGNGTTDTYFSETNGDDVIVTVGDGKLTLRGAASLETLNILGTFVDNVIILDDTATSPATLDASIEIADASARTKAIKITGNALDNSIVGGSGKDTLYGGEGNDILDGGKGNDKLYGQAGDDTLSGGAGNDTLWGGDGEDLFVYTGGKDVIADYVAGEDAILLGAAVSNASVSGNNVVLTVGNGTLNIKNGKLKELYIIDAEGNELTTIIGGAVLDNSASTPYNLAADVEYADATARTKAIRINGNDLNNTILGGTGKDTLYGGDGTDSLLGGAGADKLYGQDGEDTLYGGEGNDTLTGGEGDDVFVYTGGKDVIADYTSGDDKISLGAAYTKSTISGDNVVLTISTGNTLTIRDGKYKAITFVGTDGSEYTETFGGLQLDNSAGATTLASGVEFADASSRTKAIRITGNDLNNTILGGSGKDVLYGMDGEDSLLGNAGNDKLYGGDGDDTLTGGAGADSLWGGDGADTFVYADGDGKDFIYDFDEDDMLQITGTFSGTYNVGTNTVAIKVGTTAAAITLEDFTATNFNINGDTYRISGTKLVKK